MARVARTARFLQFARRQKQAAEKADPSFVDRPLARAVEYIEKEEKKSDEK